MLTKEVRIPNVVQNRHYLLPGVVYAQWISLFLFFLQLFDLISLAGLYHLPWLDTSLLVASLCRGVLNAWPNRRQSLSIFFSLLKLFVGMSVAGVIYKGYFCSCCSSLSGCPWRESSTRDTSSPSICSTSSTTTNCWGVSSRRSHKMVKKMMIYLSVLLKCMLISMDRLK